MSTITDRLKALSRMESTYPHILTAYLRLREQGQDRSREARIFFKNRIAEIESVLSGDSKGKAHLAKEVAVVEAMLNQDVNHDAESVALVVCGGEVVERFDVNFAFQNQVSYRRVPHISQLAFMDEETRPSLVVTVDAKSARIFDLAGGTLVNGDTLNNDLGSHVTGGGWSRLHYQRRLEQQKKEHLEEVATQLTNVVRNGHFKRILLVGPEKMTAGFLEYLPSEVSKKVVDRTRFDHRRSDRDLVNHALKFFTDADTVEEEERVRRARIEIHSSGMAVAGLNNVLRYVNSGQAYEVMLDVDLAERGVECNECGAISWAGAGRLGKCPNCDASHEHLADVDLKELMTRRTLNYGIKLYFMRSPLFRETLGKACAMLHSPHTV